MLSFRCRLCDLQGNDERIHGFVSWKNMINMRLTFRVALSNTENQQPYHTMIAGNQTQLATMSACGRNLLEMQSTGGVCCTFLLKNTLHMRRLAMYHFHSSSALSLSIMILSVWSFSSKLSNRGCGWITVFFELIRVSRPIILAVWAASMN